MALKRKIPKLEDVDEKYRGEYEPIPEGGGFRLKLEPDPDEKDLKAQLAEFRDNNRGMHRELEELRPLKAKLPADFDLEVYNKGKEALDQLKKGELDSLLKGGKVDEYLDRKTAEMKRSYEAKLEGMGTSLKTLEAERAQLRQRLESEVLDKMILETIEGGGVENRAPIAKIRTGARADVLARGRTLFGMNDKGEIEIKADAYDKAGKKYTLETWAQSLTENASHLVEPSKGGGAHGSSATSEEGKIVLRNPDPVTFARYADKIAKGEVIVKTD